MSMIVVEQKKNEHFIKKGDKISELYIILKGSVVMKRGREEITLESGAVIGVMECAYGKYFCDFYAKEDTLLVTYAFEEIKDLKQIFDEQPQYIYAFLHASLTLEHKLIVRYRQMVDSTRELYLFMVRHYREYQSVCKSLEIAPVSSELMAQFKPVELKSVIRQWEFDYAKALGDLPDEVVKGLYGKSQELSIGELCNGSVLMYKAISSIGIMQDYMALKQNVFISPNRDDFLNCWFELAKAATLAGADIEPIQKKVKELQTFIMEKKIVSGPEMLKRFQEFWSCDFDAEINKPSSEESEEEKDEVTEIIEALEPEPIDLSDVDYFEYIINYADFDEEKMESVRKLRSEYVNVVKNNDHSNEIDIRNRMTALFYEIYEKAFFKSTESSNMSPIMGLFFNFGFLDAQLVDEENITKLLELNEKINNIKEENFYTIYQWLLAILNGEKETSKNEFGLDYFASLRELRKANKITAEDEKFYKLDREKMVKFEIENMFRAANRVTFGRSLAFSPILEDSYIVKDPNLMWMSPARIKAAIDNIRALDFSCFYRDVLFYDPEHEGGRMMIKKEIMPEIIFLPNAGNEGMMWQESAGTSREAPGRFVFPMISIMDIDNVMLEVIGNYRWEICRKLQGMRWNDITERSLTSEYYDYLQFYKKNKILSAAAKDKIKNQLVKSKGSYSKLFIQDYIQWIKYESNGNFRINKVSREIIAKYCPFVAETRYKLLENPIFKGTFSKYENLTIQQETKFKNALKKYKDHGGEITPELMEALHYFQK